jgi:uncharacterized BrkB/YihY/UPF0761 family membrane protein
VRVVANRVFMWYTASVMVYNVVRSCTRQKMHDVLGVVIRVLMWYTASVVLCIVVHACTSSKMHTVLCVLTRVFMWHTVLYCCTLLCIHVHVQKRMSCHA